MHLPPPQGIVQSHESEQNDKKSKEEKKEQGDSSLIYGTEQSLKRSGRKEKRKRGDERSSEEQGPDETMPKKVMDFECLRGVWSFPGRYVFFASRLCKTVPHDYPQGCTF